MTNRAKSKWRPQVALGDLLLLIAVVATAMAWYQTRSRLTETRASMKSMQVLARELQIDDRNKIAVVSRAPTKPNELIFDVYVPNRKANQPPKRLNLVLDDIVRNWQSKEPLAEPQLTSALPPGRHAVEVRHIEPVGESPDAEHTVEILLDDVVVMSAKRPRSWQTTGGWTGSGNMAESRSFDPDKPVELHRRRFHEKTATGSQSADPNKPANGILLWIE